MGHVYADASSAAPPRRALHLLPSVPVTSSRRTPGYLLVFPVGAAVAALVVAGSLRDAELVLTGALAGVALVRITGAARHVVATPYAHGAAVLKAMLTPLALLALGLHVAGLPRGTVDDVLVMGGLAATLGAVVAFAISLGGRPSRTILVGDLDQVEEMLARWSEGPHLDVVGALVLDQHVLPADTAVLGVPVVGSLEALSAHVAAARVDLVVVGSGTGDRAVDVRRLGWLLEGSRATLAIAGAGEHVSPHRLSHQVLDGATMTLVSTATTWHSHLVKAVLDRVLATLLIVVFLPLLAVLALAVRLDSTGPALFSQTRVGRGGRTFRLYKLRTMTVDAEETKCLLVPDDTGNGVLFKMRQDPRVTRLGRVLRVLSLDELPQLWNVITGDMSLVGPRPALPEEVARYTDLERRRLSVKPGLTGPWQVSGRSSLSRERAMELDVGYADNWRPVGDARILLRTIDAVLTRRGAF